jgi:hypothetical protein
VTTYPLVNIQQKVFFEVGVLGRGQPIPVISDRVPSAPVLDLELKTSVSAAKMIKVTGVFIGNDLLHDVLLPALRQPRPHLGVRWWVGDRPTDWEPFYVAEYKFDPGTIAQSSGQVQVFFTLYDLLYELGVNRNISAHSGTISQIVSRVLGKNKLDVVVEDSLVRFTMLQCMESDLSFIRRIGRYAVNKSGAGGYRLYKLGNKVHFHTAGYAQSTAWHLSMVASALKPVYEGSERANMRMGSAGAEALSFDPVTGVYTSVVSKPPQESSRIYPQFERAAIESTPVTQPVEKSACWAQSAYDEISQQSFKLVFSLDNQPLVVANDTVNVEFPYRSPYSGTYTVTHANATFRAKKGWVTQVILARGYHQKVTEVNQLSAS